MRRLLCRLGIHSWFRQFDRWGSADVCRYCVAVKNEFTVQPEQESR